MKILQVIPYFYLSWSEGQPVELVFELARSLVARGHEVTVFTTDTFNKATGHSAVSASVIEGVKVFEFRSIGKLPPSFSSGFMRALIRNIRRFDVIHIHEFRTTETLVTAHLARLAGVPYVLQAHGALETGIGRSKAKIAHDRLFGARVVRAAAGLIALTEHEAELYRAFHVESDRVAVIPNGLSTRDYQDHVIAAGFRAKHGIADTERLVTYVGRLVATKGLDLLVESFVGVLSHVPNSRLLIIGKDYGYEARLRLIIKKLGLEEKVLFLGFVAKEEKLAAYVNSDVFVTPYYNGLPRAFLEACATGTPIVTTTKGDPLSWIDGHVGLVVRPTTEAVQDAIVRILTDRDFRLSLSNNCVRTVQRSFDWAVVTGLFEAVYTRVVDEARGNKWLERAQEDFRGDE